MTVCLVIKQTCKNDLKDNFTGKITSQKPFKDSLQLRYSLNRLFVCFNKTKRINCSSIGCGQRWEFLMQEMVVVQKVMLETPQKQGMLMASLENSTTLTKFLAAAMRKVHNNVTKKVAWQPKPCREIADHWPDTCGENAECVTGSEVWRWQCMCRYLQCHASDSLYEDPGVVTWIL